MGRAPLPLRKHNLGHVSAAAEPGWGQGENQSLSLASSPSNSFSHFSYQTYPADAGTGALCWPSDRMRLGGRALGRQALWFVGSSPGPASASHPSRSGEAQACVPMVMDGMGCDAILNAPLHRASISSPSAPAERLAGWRGPAPSRGCSGGLTASPHSVLSLGPGAGGPVSPSSLQTDNNLIG